MNDTVGAAEKKFSINFSKARTKFCLCLLIIVTVVIYSFTKKSITFKANNKNENFPTNISEESISEKFELGEMSSQKKHRLQKMFMIF